jgi:tetratricopeptide (TPR) repeat protein
MGETLSLLFRRRDDGSFELQLKEGWSGRGVTGSFVPPYNGRQIKALQKKLNNLDSSTDELRKIGQRLFLALCGSEKPGASRPESSEQSVQAVLRGVIQRTLRRRGTVALTFIFGPGCDEFVRYPWELLHNGNHFLLVSGIFTLTRALLRQDLPTGGELPVRPPLRVLYIGASPSDCVSLETERSFEALSDAFAALSETNQVFIDRLEPPTIDNLVSYLNSYGGASMLNDSDTDVPCYVVHFDGHGSYGRLCPQDGCGLMNDADARKCQNCATSLNRIQPQTYLCFCDNEGCNHFIDTPSLCDLFLSSDIRLAVFSACETARVTGEVHPSQRAAVDATLATALVMAQVPAVVAMPFSLQDELSPVFVRHFYEALVDGRTIEEALARARQALLPMQHRSWFIPVLYRLVTDDTDGPVALLARSDAPDDSEHPLAYLGVTETFVGRERELHELSELLAAAVTGEQRPDISGRLRLRHGTHHFALTGSAGIGKSALAFEAAQRNRAKFPGGVVGVSLQGGKLFVDALLELVQHLHIPTRSTTADASHRARLILGTFRSLANRDLPCLLLLDNFEEVRDHAELEAWLHFLSNVPQEIVVLVTSRSNPETLLIAGDAHCRWYEYHVGNMLDSDLLTLFSELAASNGLDQRIHLDDQRQQAVLREICTLLDGYPLGAELIFGTTRSIGGRVYTPEAATRSLEEVRNELQSTPLAGILAVLDIAYRHIQSQARLLLAYLSVMKLPFSHEQIAVLVAPEMLANMHTPLRLVREQEQQNGHQHAHELELVTEEVVPLDLVEHWREARDELVQASFMQFDGRVYSIHSQVRHFAFSHLPLEERQRLHRVVATYYSSLPQPAPEEWFVAFDHLESAGEPQDMQEALRLAVRASWALSGRGHATELLAMLSRAGVHASRIDDRTGEGQIQCCMGAILRQQGQYTEAEGCLRSSLEYHRQQNEHVEAGWAIYELALLSREEGNFRQAISYAEEGLALFREAGDVGGEAWMLMVVGETRRGLASYDDALAHFNQVLTTFRILNEKEGWASTLRDRGIVYEALGQYENALKDFDEAFRIFHEAGLQVGQAWVFVDQSVVYVDLGRLEQAEKICTEAFQLFHEQGIRRGEAWALYVRGNILRTRGDLLNARNYYDEALSLFSALGDRVDQARVLNALGAIVGAEDDPLTAQNYHEQALAIALEQGAKQLQGRALRGLGDVAHSLQQLAEAQCYYHDAYEIARELVTPAEQCAVLRRQGTLTYEQGQFHQTLEYWMQGLHLDQRLEHPARTELEAKVSSLVAEQHLEKAYTQIRERSAHSPV